ncbi:PTS sugar transporter subunit IIC [Erysipelothrix inopinata]|uniref:PTS sugar transporter subunit IIC n=1 Tax=Erysipelothrix inopinata TaxID=225084 RepID=A0A7G9RW88_9FIRM|nr:PTS sugar transporter subunit IIC [Erysipelothrix inopinata]QNN59863.1 PTS sugar transporter subunit IIC [Erysipelothrix inopinata]
MSTDVKREKLSLSQFIMKVVNGSTSGIIVAVIPNAIFGQIFLNLIPTWEGFRVLYELVQIIQLLMPVLVGIGVARQFNLDLIPSLSVGAAAFLGSGNVINNAGMWQLVGIGDTVNAMLVSGIAVWFVFLIENKVKAFVTIAYPTIVGAGAGIIGYLTLPYVSSLTRLIGNIVGTATELQPIVMSVIIAVIFAILILTPISVVAIAIAISLDGIGSGAANLGLVAVVLFMAMGSHKAKNEAGITISIILGGVKAMMPNFFKNLKIMIPVAICSGIMGALAPILNIQGTPASAGFGFAGLVGPLVAYGYLEHSAILNIIILVLVYAVIPFIVCGLTYKFSRDGLKVIKDTDFEATI